MAASGIDKALGISPQVLALRMKRMNLLTANIANADTPNYKARDIDFRAAMASATASGSYGCDQCKTHCVVGWIRATAG